MESYLEQFPLLPPSCARRVGLFLEALPSKIGEERIRGLWGEPLWIQTMARVMGCSEFCKRVMLKYPEEAAEFFFSGGMARTFRKEYFESRWKEACDYQNESASFMKALRKFRHLEMFRIAWRDLGGLATLQETLEETSLLADCILEKTTHHILQQQKNIYGRPLSGKGEESHFFVVALGKLGGRELNFSSDIDLMFVYSKEGHTEGNIQITNEQFYGMVARQLIQFLNEMTEEGFVYRVDLRLRPYGDKGPLVMCEKSLEAYYQLQGREWERYALIKARVVVGPKENTVESIFKTFVYRRYVDYSAIESLREMKSLLNREQRRLHLQENIKRGPGGIREVEFMVQVFQLIRGGKEPHLQTSSLLNALYWLSFLGKVPREFVMDLKKAYEFLRRLENHLQMMDDRQTQVLPVLEEEQEALAFSMGYEDWESLYKVRLAHQEKVQQHFKNTIALPKEKQVLPPSFHLFQDVWQRSLKKEKLKDFFELFKTSEEGIVCHELLTQLKDSHPLKSASLRGKERMDQLIPILLSALLKEEEPQKILSRIIPILEAIAKRSAYIALLIENETVLKHLVLYCAKSPWVSEKIANFPLLMDEVLLAYQSPPAMTSDILNKELQQMLLNLSEDDLEGRMEMIRQFKHTHEVRVALYELFNLISSKEASEYLSLVAEVILQRVYEASYEFLLSRHGAPTALGKEDEPAFAMIAYGKLGSKELTYESDLDLVFLHDGDPSVMTEGAYPISHGEFYIRLGQRIIHHLSVMTLTGTLYQIDTRLRPSGRAGLLVSSWKAYEHYQLTEAWTWEHQALIRARVILGGPFLTEQFNSLRKQVLQRKPSEKALKEDIVNMRLKLLSEKSPSETIKHSEGGMIDLEFLIQFAVLCDAHQQAELTESTQSLPLIHSLVKTKFFTPEEGTFLEAAWKAYHEAFHQQTLQKDPTWRPTQMKTHQTHVLACWHRIMGAVN